MRVLRLISGLDPDHGGPSVSSLNSCIAAQRSGASTTFAFSLRPSGTQGFEWAVEQLHDEGIETVMFPQTRLLGGLGKRWGVSPELRQWIAAHRKEFDIVHCHGAWQYLTLITALGDGRKLPRVLTPHESLTDFDLTEAGGPFTRLVKRRLRPHLLRKFDRIVVASQIEARDSVPAGMREDIVCEVIPHPVFDDQNLSTPARAPPPTPESLRLGFLGRLHRKKNLDVVIRSLSQLPQGVTLAVAGDGPEGDGLRSLALEAGVSARIEWLGFLNEASKPEFFGNIDVLVLPSQYECFGMAAAEAMAAGVPVIVSPDTGIAETLRQHGGGFVVPPTADDIAGNVNDLVRRQEELAGHSEQAAAAAKLAFSFSAHGKALCEAYESLITIRQTGS